MSNILKKRSALTITLIAIAIIAASSQVARQVNSDIRQDCLITSYADLAFVVDMSGSMDPLKRGQTYNVQIEGIVRSLRDPAVIPRDGSVAVSIFTFAKVPTLRLELTAITSRESAEQAASQIEALKCVCEVEQSCPGEGSDPASNFGAALNAAYTHLKQKDQSRESADPRKNARRLLVLSTDGGCTDIDNMGGCNAKDVENARRDAAISGIGLELDVILVGLKPDEIESSKRRVASIPSPPPPDKLPGATLVVEAGNCNDSGQCDFLEDCSHQADLFADRVRSAIRSDVSPINITVNTEDDTPVDEPPAGQQTISLRQAISIANANRGNAIISFKDVETVKLTAPLPALAQPDIKIDGGGLVTIDGASITSTQQGGRHEDGLLIRSNRITVHRMRVINFRRAGITIAPLSQCDFAGQNTISQNRLENNTEAGILVLDSPDDIPGNNLNNTFTGNIFSGSSIPIDLGGDGLTQNDACDLDEGPNHLINHPELLTATTEGNSVAVRGRVGSDGCVVAGAAVEIFALTITGSASAQAQIRTLTPVASAVANSEGFFSVSFSGDPLIEYTATVTDLDGNTSEMSSLCESKAHFDTTKLEFKLKSARPKSRKLKKQDDRTFTITNTGCSTLALRFESIERNGPNGITDPDDYREGKGFFSVRRITNFNNSLEDEEILFKRDGLVIQPNKSMSFRVRFNPVIPALAKCKCTNMLAASEVLPDKINSTLTISFNGASQEQIALSGSVKTSARLINPDIDKPRLPALVTLTRSGDTLKVAFSVYDSDRNVKQVTYTFLDSLNKSVLCRDSNNKPIECAESLTEQISHLIKGQSVRFEQEFFNVGQHLEISKVQVTIKDADGSSDTASSGPVSLAAGGTQFRATTSASSEMNLLKAKKLYIFQIPASKVPGKAGERKN